MSHADSLIDFTPYKTRADAAYASLKQDILDYRLAPGDRFTETEVAERLEVSRTPVREALFRLEREGYLEVRHRNGWQVKTIDFNALDHFYDLRIVLEVTAAERICRQRPAPESVADHPLLELARIWCVTVADRLDDGDTVADLDERFHRELVAMSGNPEMSRVHRAGTERIRIVRRLDFTDPARIQETYAEHSAIIRALLSQNAEVAISLLRHHIEASQAEVRKITLHRLYSVRPALPRV
jgi:DNA-binding GntR family transcriptional regulator